MLASPLAASAHVRVSPIRVAPDTDDTLLTFAVPTESASATTVKVVINLPTATPFGDVDYQPVAGWTAEVVTSKLPKPALVDGARVTEAPTSVVWTADPTTRLVGGQIQLFVLSVGPMPDTGKISLPTVQTYSDGSVVRWTDVTPASGEEPEHPAPIVYIRDTPPDGPVAGDLSVTASAQSGAPATAVVIGGIVALVIAIVALLLAIVALVRLRTAVISRR